MKKPVSFKKKKTRNRSTYNIAITLHCLIYLWLSHKLLKKIV